MMKYAAPLTLFAVCLSAPVVAGDIASITQHRHDNIVHATTVAPGGAGTGWQNYVTYDPPTGQNVMFTYQCPTSAPTAVNGAFNTNAAARNGFSLVANYRVGNDASKWTWVIFWPSGAPATSRIFFNIFCGR